MRLINADNAAAYLRELGQIEGDEPVEVCELAGGVSNVVLLVSPPAAPAFVLKQSRQQLRVADPWFCSVERIWREVEVMRICDRLLATPPGEPLPEGRIRTPSVLFTDDANYLFGMTAAPPHTVWKQQLLNGEVHQEVATACGQLLGTLHAGCWRDAEVAKRIGDRTFFDDLRVDPYYRHLGRRQPDLCAGLDRLCRSLEDHCLSLVHGDFSPKNLLVSESGLLLVDFEVGHFGDPAFDLGFFLSHLVLKAVYARSGAEPYLQLTQRFWRSYLLQLEDQIPAASIDELSVRGILHCAACMLARVDGKSPVEYLDDIQRDMVRAVGRQLWFEPPQNWSQALDALRPFC